MTLEDLVIVRHDQHSISVLIEEGDNEWAIIWNVDVVDYKHMIAAQEFAVRIRASISRFIESQK